MCVKNILTNKNIIICKSAIDDVPFVTPQEEASHVSYHSMTSVNHKILVIGNWKMLFSQFNPEKMILSRYGRAFRRVMSSYPIIGGEDIMVRYA